MDNFVGKYLRNHVGGTRNYLMEELIFQTIIAKNSKTMSESIGMMDKAYFVGKVEILNWFNTLLQVSL